MKNEDIIIEQQFTINIEFISSLTKEIQQEIDMHLKWLNKISSLNFNNFTKQDVETSLFLRSKHSKLEYHK